MQIQNAAASAPGRPVTNLLLVRHGETEWNKAKRIQGQIDIPLSDVGVRQAALLAQRLVHEQVHVDAVVSSDLSRAMMTATSLADVYGLTVVRETGLRERHFGQFQAMDADEIAVRWPEAHAQWRSLDPDFGPEGGESFRQLSGRVVATLGAIARRFEGKTVICVAHGGVLDAAYRFAAGVALDAPRACTLLNTSLNHVHWTLGVTDIADIADVADVAERADSTITGDRARVHAWGDVAHLVDLNVRDEI